LPLWTKVAPGPDPARMPQHMERSFAGAAPFRRLARDDERLPATLAVADFHLLVFVIFMLPRFVALMMASACHALVNPAPPCTRCQVRRGSVF